MGGEGTGSPEAELLRAFVNTCDVEAGSDALADRDALVRWLAAHELLPDQAAAATPADHALALAMREGLRAALRRHHDPADGAETAAAALTDVARDLPLVLDFTPDPPALRSVDGGVRGALAALLGLVPRTVADGSWARLKVCPADDCAWAFFDSSRNRSRTWCAMSVCGNRTKTRAYRARRKASS